MHEKDEINVPIVLSAFRDGDQGPSKVMKTGKDKLHCFHIYIHAYARTHGHMIQLLHHATNTDTMFTILEEQREITELHMTSHV